MLETVRIRPFFGQKQRNARLRKFSKAEFRADVRHRPLLTTSAFLGVFEMKSRAKAILECWGFPLELADFGF